MTAQKRCFQAFLSMWLQLQRFRIFSILHLTFLYFFVINICIEERPVQQFQTACNSSQVPKYTPRDVSLRNSATCNRQPGWHECCTIRRVLTEGDLRTMKFARIFALT